MNRDYTTDYEGRPAIPNTTHVYSRTEALPYILGAETVRRMAGEVADSIIADARTVHGPVVWITGNQYMPPLRDIPDAERVWNADNNRDGELFAWFAEMVDDNLSRAQVILECPDYDNALYAVDLRRWQWRENAEEDVDDLNEYWEPRDPDAVDDNTKNPVCAMCGGELEESDQYPEAGYLHKHDSDDTHAPELADE